MKFEVKHNKYICAKTNNNDYYIWHDGTIHNLACNTPIDNMYKEGWWCNDGEAEEFLKNWLPQSGWIDKAVVTLAANAGDKNALLASITHWKQIVLAGPKDYREAQYTDKVSTNQAYCSLCQRYGNTNNPCPLKGDVCGGFACVKEYTDASTNLIYQDKIDGAVSLLNKLIGIYNNLYGKEIKMSSIDNRLVQVSTDIKALEVEKQKLLEEKKKSEQYIFQPGDVVENDTGEKRIIVNLHGEILSFGINGNYKSTGQKTFECWGYKKIGVMKDFIK